MIGQIGQALTDLAPEGKVFVHGEYWDAVAVQPVSRGRARQGDGHRPAETDGGTRCGLRRRP